MLQHVGALEGLLRLAPTGFPAQVSMRAGLLLLHDKFQIFDCKASQLEKISNEAASAWRGMCKELYNIKKSGCLAKPGLKCLLDLVQLPSSSPGPRVAPVSGPALDELFPDMDGLSDFGPMNGDKCDDDDDSDVSSVEITGEVCRCPDCCPLTTCAHATTESRPTDRVGGSVVQAKKAVPLRRYNQKTTMPTGTVIKKPVRLNRMSNPTGLKITMKIGPCKWKFVCAQTERKCPHYSRNVATVMAEINRDMITTTGQAQKRLRALI